MRASCLRAACLLLAVSIAAVSQERRPASPSHVRASLSSLPICFIENRGVCPERVAYYVQGSDKTLFFTPEGITFRLKGQDQDWVVKLEFVGGNPDVVPQGEDRQPAVFSYFRGPEKDWRTGLATFGRVLYPDLWPGIDLGYTATASELKYAFVVKPGADPGKIRLRYCGAASVTLTGTGALRVETAAASFEDAPPVAFQEAVLREARGAASVGRDRVEVSLEYALDPEKHEFGFEVGPYDRTKPLILDPAVLLYCGYLGGASTDYGFGIALDGSGNAYVTGRADSNRLTFPVTVGPDTSQNGAWDAFVAKVNPQGTGLVYCGYIGGTSDDYGAGIAVDAAGSAYVTGRTDCSREWGFPVRVGPDLTANGGDDAFVAKVNAQGTGLDYCGYLGGYAGDAGTAIAVDASGCAYVAGYTWSHDASHSPPGWPFPTTVGPDLTHNGSYGDVDAFVGKLDPTGTTWLYCGYIGGQAIDRGYGIAVDAGGHAYVVGTTQSDAQTFPVAVGPDLVHNGAQDAFVAKVNPQGTALDYCGYIGGAADDCGYGVAVDAASSAYVSGMASSSEQTFPVAVGPDLVHNGGFDAFVAKVNALGTALDYCGYLGGHGPEYGYGVAVDPAGGAYVVGTTQSDAQTFPVAVGPDLTHNGREDAFVAKVNPQGTALDYCGYLGGSAMDVGRGIAVDATGNAYVAGFTGSSEPTFPVTAGPDLTHNGSDDAFVAKVSLTLLQKSGAAQPGGTVRLALTATDDSGLPYVIGSSLGTGPMPIDARRIDLSPDDLLVATAGNSWPAIFTGYRGVIGPGGQASAAIHIASIPGLVGLRIHSAFVTVHPAAPSGIQSIANTTSFQISP
ncbi:MAG: SBBP repeat-containing protein [Planctomycetes bacterium]|nr:SBBP repeat-containing protein [Planctomycetota bacterium]